MHLVSMIFSCWSPWFAHFSHALKQKLNGHFLPLLGTWLQGLDLWSFDQCLCCPWQKPWKHAERKLCFHHHRISFSAGDIFGAERWYSCMRCFQCNKVLVQCRFLFLPGGTWEMLTLLHTTQSSVHRWSRLVDKDFAFLSFQSTFNFAKLKFFQFCFWEFSIFKQAKANDAQRTRPFLSKKTLCRRTAPEALAQPHEHCTIEGRWDEFGPEMQAFVCLYVGAFLFEFTKLLTAKDNLCSLRKEATVWRHRLHLWALDQGCALPFWTVCRPFVCCI